MSKKKDKDDSSGLVSTMRIAGAGAMHLPGTAGYIGDVTTVTADAIEADSQIARDRRALQEEFGLEGSLKHSGSRAFKEMDDKINGKVEHAAGGSAALISGGVAGTVGATTLAGLAMGGPVGGVAAFLVSAAGSITGGMAAQAVYERVTEKADPDALIIERMLEKRGGPISAEEAYAALAGNIPDTHGGKEIRDALEKLTGTRDFAQALKRGKHDAIRKLMDSQEYAHLDTIVAAATGSIEHSSVIAARYAEDINNGKLHMRALLVNNDNLNALLAEAGMPGVSADLQIQQAASSLRQSGVTPALDSEGRTQLLPLTSQEIGRS
jgi:hypothetical protein